MNAATSPSLPSGMNRLERRVMAIGTSIVLHAVILGGAAALQAVVARAGRLAWVPQETLLMATVGLLFAHASLAAVGIARASWPAYAKLLAIFLSAAGIWWLLVGALQNTSPATSAGAVWAAMLLGQSLLVGASVWLLEMALNPEAAVRNRRFSLLFLFLQTAVVAVLLGAVRATARALGWTFVELQQWEWLYQVLSLGAANGLLAVGTFAAFRWSGRWTSQFGLAGAILVATAVATPLLMVATFGNNVGAPASDIAWLMLFQGLFLLAALGPQAALRGPTENAASARPAPNP